jgi:Protein of unknown function (DUF3349)
MHGPGCGGAGTTVLRILVGACRRIEFVLARILGFLRGGYPEAVPATGYLPLFGLLQCRVSDDDAAAVAGQLLARGQMPIADTDIGVAITKITSGLPSAQDTDRVRQRIEAMTATAVDNPSHTASAAIQREGRTPRWCPGVVRRLTVAWALTPAERANLRASRPPLAVITASLGAHPPRQHGI